MVFLPLAHFNILKLIWWIFLLPSQVFKVANKIQTKCYGGLLTIFINCCLKVRGHKPSITENYCTYILICSFSLLPIIFFPPSVILQSCSFLLLLNRDATEDFPSLQWSAFWWRPKDQMLKLIQKVIFYQTFTYILKINAGEKLLCKVNAETDSIHGLLDQKNTSPEKKFRNDTVRVVF